MEKNYLNKMTELCKSEDTETAHREADEILCQLVAENCPNGREIVAAFKRLQKWYA